MKKLSLLGLLTALFATFYFFSREEAPVIQKNIKTSTAGTRKLFLGARQSTKVATAVSLTSGPLDGCEELNTQLEKIDFNLEVKEWVSYLDPASFIHCTDPQFQSRLTDINTKCFEKYDEAACVQQAVFLRALLRTRNLADAEDRETLADLVLREFADNNPDFEKLGQYAERLLDFDPDQAAFQKLWAAAKVISSIDKGLLPNELTSALGEKVNDELWQDPEMQGLKLAVVTGLQPENVEQYARSFLSERPDPRMHEILGWSLWRQNRFAEATQELQRAIQLNPKDEWLKNQLKRVISKEADINSYQARLSLGVNLEDLYN